MACLAAVATVLQPADQPAGRPQIACSPSEEDATQAAPSGPVGGPRKLQDPYYSDFVIGLMTPEQLKLLLKFGKNRHMHIDATHGTNNAKVPALPLIYMWVDLWLLHQIAGWLCTANFTLFQGRLSVFNSSLCCAVSAHHHTCGGHSQQWTACGILCAQPQYQQDNSRLLEGAARSS